MLAKQVTAKHLAACRLQVFGMNVAVDFTAQLISDCMLLAGHSYKGSKSIDCHYPMAQTADCYFDESKEQQQ